MAAVAAAGGVRAPGAIAYRYRDALYLNITNDCPCDCSFCLRSTRKGIGDAESLWLDCEPTFQQVIAAIERYRPLDSYSEVVFCGFGEPFSSYDVMLAVARWLKEEAGVKHVRVNTNGLGDLIVGRQVACELAGIIDELSISLNAPDAATFEELCNPEFGIDSFDAVLSFAAAAKAYVPHINLSVVDFLSDEDMQKTAEIADELKLPLKVRHFS
ncbi:MAG: TatD family nuclease-associated radical SAM protein [Coriobacteriia bacterium]|nr:TatD family nuclease-associated radical SAM protein [Coriobacteriia bacterium]